MHRLVMTVFAAAVAATGAVRSDGAVISQVRGEVTLQTAALGGSRYPARPLQIVAPGSTLSLSDSSAAVVICADDRAVELSGPTQWQPGTGSCRNGRPVASGTYARLLPAEGRTIDFHGSLLTEAPTRSDDEGGEVPVLLRPRSPQLLTVLVGEASPVLVWTAVSQAQSYDLVLQRGGKEQAVEGIPPRCQDELLTEPLRTCTADWPWPPLRPGEAVELRVRAHTLDPDRPIRTTDAAKLRLADADARRAVDGRLAALAAGGLPKATDALLRANVYADARLFNEAAEALGVAMEESPHAAVAVRLADLYLGLGQLRAALNTYGRAEALLPSTGENEIRAALHLGRGRLWVRKKDDYLAAQDLRKAARLFRRLGNDAEAADAEREAELASRTQQ